MRMVQRALTRCETERCKGIAHQGPMSEHRTPVLSEWELEYGMWGSLASA